MGSSESSHRANASDNSGGKSKGGIRQFGVRGLKKVTKSNEHKEEEERKEVAELVEREDEEVLVDEPVAVTLEEEESDDEDVSSDEEDEDEESDDEEEDEEYEEFLMERLRVLEDARRLKDLANAFLHPEKPVVAEPTTPARCYFDRPSAPEVESPEEAEERAKIIADAAELKELAVDYAHPELGVENANPTATARCYFDRASAPERVTVEEAEEEAQILKDAAMLKRAAFEYLHPEVGVETMDPTCFGRNYFERPSAPEEETPEEAEERAQILADAAALKKLAGDYTHPEIGVESSDPTLFGRNYFERPSAPEIEDDEYADERAEVLAEAAALKKLAVDYAHPEVGVKAADPTLFGRNYFGRASAAEVEDEEEAEESARVLAEAAALKKLAVDYAHPEVGVDSVDPALFGRNYFERPSAPEIEDDEYADERADVLADAAALKKLAVDYAHPEVGVKATDPTLFGRNYFGRASAPEVEDEDYAEERAKVQAEAAALKKHAVDYAHPEVGVGSVDPTLFGRNYFDRPSAPETEDEDYAEERARVLAEAAALKKLAVDYAHPETGVESADPAEFGRNYFDRASAPEVETPEEADERAQILAEAAALKKYAVDYAHPETAVTVTDPAAFGRNYFNRPSAPETETPLQEKSEVQESEAPAAVLGQLKAQVKQVNPKVEDKSDEGEMNRSPSSVMLFGLEEQGQNQTAY